MPNIDDVSRHFVAMRFIDHIAARGERFLATMKHASLFSDIVSYVLNRAGLLTKRDLWLPASRVDDFFIDVTLATSASSRCCPSW